MILCCLDAYARDREREREGEGEGTGKRMDLAHGGPPPICEPEGSDRLAEISRRSDAHDWSFPVILAEAWVRSPVRK